jgi:HlyD family secretion protein
MKPWKKIAIGAGAAVVLALIVGITVHQSGKNVATVQTGKAQREDLTAVVSASGEIRPKTYVNIGANAFGKITHIFVKEGNQVRKGQLPAQLENVQSSANEVATGSYKILRTIRSGSGVKIDNSILKKEDET